jgi:hypothetical protein
VPRQILYGGVGLAAAVAAFAVLEPASRRIFAWAAATTTVVGLVALCHPLLAQGINPASTTWSALVSGQPDQIIFGVFQQAFLGSGQGALEETAQANLRHGLASALALSIFLTALVRPALAAARRPVADVGIVAASLFLALTLSRSAIVAVLLWLTFLAVTPLVRGRGSVGQWVVPVVLLVSLISIFVLPVTELFEERFITNEGSAEVRGSNLLAVLEHADRFVLGANGVTPASSPHNVVFDGLLAGGLVGAVAGLVLLAAYALVLARLAVDHVVDRPWALPLSRAAAVGIGLVPLVRLLSAGGGQLNLAEWVGAGMFMGLVALERRQAERAARSPMIAGTPDAGGPPR